LFLKARATSTNTWEAYLDRMNYNGLRSLVVVQVSLFLVVFGRLGDAWLGDFWPGATTRTRVSSFPVTDSAVRLRVFRRSEAWALDFSNDTQTSRIRPVLVGRDSSLGIPKSPEAAERMVHGKQKTRGSLRHAIEQVHAILDLYEESTRTAPQSEYGRDAMISPDIVLTILESVVMTQSNADEFWNADSLEKLEDLVWRLDLYPLCE
jgi:hypothetical protein